MAGIVSPPEARRAGSYIIEARFDLRQLDILRDRMVEVDSARRSLARYLVENGYDYAIGTVRLGLADGGHAAASIARRVIESSSSPEDYRVFPREPLPMARLRDTLRAGMPPALRAWLDVGAWVCGEPAMEGAVAELPLLLPLARMRGRFARSFLSRAA